MSDTQQDAEHNEIVWTKRVVTIREDGLEGIPNLFKRLFHLPLDTYLSGSYEFQTPIVIGPGESVTLAFPLPLLPIEDDQ